MTSRFSISTTSSSSTSSTCSYSPPVSPDLPTSSTLPPNAYLSPTSTTSRHHHIPRWPALSKDGLPRSSASSLTRPHRFHSSGTMTPPTRTPSPPTRSFTPPSATAATTISASTCPTHPAATSAARRSSPPSLELGSRPLPPRNALGLVECGGNTATNNKRSKTAIVRMGRSMGRGLRQCSGFFKPRPDDPDDVDEVPKPVHWSEN